MIITQDFIKKVEDSFETLSCDKNKKNFAVFYSLVKESLENEPDVLDTVYKILYLLNNSTPEQVEVLLSIDTYELIKMVK